MSDKTYKTLQGDTWDLISYKLYGSEKHIDELMQENMPFVDYVVFPANIILNVPELPVSDTDLLAPEWRRTI